MEYQDGEMKYVSAVFKGNDKLPCLQSSAPVSQTQSPVNRSQMRLAGQEQV